MDTIKLNPQTAPNSFADQKTDGDVIDKIANELEESGESINPFYLDCIDDNRLIAGLIDYCEANGDSAKNYIIHSNRFYNLVNQKFNPDVHILRDEVNIPAADGNEHWDGRLRREEHGRKIDLEYVKSQGIDSAHVLYFRVTQPQVDAPKPEYYWTSDFRETISGLNQELGHQAKTAIILVSTLDEISANGGIIMDVNDDGGLAVRQIGFEPFDQQQAIMSFARNNAAQ